jgi:phage anti-repressor protein/phage antirepressor YoqD-like protein
MKQLISISNGNIGGVTVQTVNARELHTFLEVGKDFSNWIKKRIEQYGFIHGIDFVTDAQTSDGGKFASIDYHITLDMGKELSMVERNAKGKEARLYFIDCERHAKAATQIESPAMQMARGLFTAVAIIEDKTALIAQMDMTIADLAPKANALDRLSTADGSLCITDAAKTLQMRPKDLFSLLSSENWIFRRAGNTGWTAFQPRLNQGLLEHKTTAVNVANGNVMITEQVRVTPKGLAKLSKFLELKEAA